MMRVVSLGLCLLWFAACSKQEADSGKQESSSSSPANKSLAYTEAVTAALDKLALEMTYDEGGEQKSMRGFVTMTKERFATVKHPTSSSKQLDLRRWAKVYVAELISDQQLPRNNRTDESPLTGQSLTANRTPEGWKHERGQIPHTAELDELDLVERSAWKFYHGHKLEPGESWQVPADAIARWFGKEVSDTTGDINVRVERLDTFEEQRCAVLTIGLATTGKMRDEEQKLSDMTLNLAGEIWRAIDLGIDLKVELKGQIQLTAKVAEQNAEVKIAGPAVITETRGLR